MLGTIWTTTDHHLLMSNGWSEALDQRRRKQILATDTEKVLVEIDNIIHKEKIPGLQMECHWRMLGLML